MQRILLLLILLAVSASAAANVGLGEIEVRSFLNQPLQAQFRAEGSALATEEVEFRLASEDAYRRAGLQRAAIPADLSIEVQGTGTSRLVRLTTQRPVREPYLGLLIEARWPAGRVLREFTILLDPPVAFAPERSVAPVITRAPEPVVREAPPPVQRAEPRAPAVGTYTVRRGDTLSAIVNRQGYVGVTPQQAMLAILDANPQAFIGGNINQLRAGAELRLPDQAEVTAYGTQEALREVRRQTAEWRERAAPTPPPAMAAAVPAPTVAAEESPAASALPPADPLPTAEPEPAEEVAAATEAAVVTDGSAEPVTESVTEPEPLLADADPAVVDRLEILGEDAFEPTMIASAGTQVIEEALLSQQVAVRELRDEVSVLRTELAERDELIRVMNTELAQLEERMQALREQPADGLLGGGADVASLHERLLADPLLMLLAATSGLLFLLLLVSLFRPRRTQVAADTSAARVSAAAAPRPVPAPERVEPTGDTGIAGRKGSAATAAGVGAAAGAAAKGVGARDQREPVSLESPTRHIDVSDEPKVEDIFADVDLYMAYGMHDQAITALENAIRDGRDDPEYRVRLVEAYAAADDGDAVRREASALQEKLRPDQQALRERVAAAEARFPKTEGDTGETPEPGTDDLKGSPDALGSALDFDLSEDVGRVKDAERGAPELDRGTLRFDLDDTPDSSVPSGEPVRDQAAADDLPEFTLPDLEPLEPESPSDSSVAGADSDTSENGMKLSLAEAFVEMGDPEGALALLEEIMPTATDAQKAKAEAIRRQIEGSDG